MVYLALTPIDDTVTDLGAFLSDPFTVRSIISIVAGALTGLLVVRVTFYLRNQRDLFNAVRAIRAELTHNLDQLAKLTTLLQADMEGHQVDRPLTVGAGTVIEFRYVLTLPSSLKTAAFDRLTQSGQLLSLPEDLRRQLFDLYDVIDRLNRLHRHRETLHYTNLGHVHVVVDATGLDIEPGETLEETELPADVRERLANLRRLNQATKGINRQMLRMVAAICPTETATELGIDAYRGGIEAVGSGGGRGRVPTLDVPDIETVIQRLDAVERESFWARFV